MKRFTAFILTLSLCLAFFTFAGTAMQEAVLNPRASVGYAVVSPDIDGKVIDGEYGEKLHSVDYATMQFGDDNDKDHSVNADFHACWDDGYLYLAFVVNTGLDAHYAADKASEIWKHCSVSFIITPSAPKNGETKFQETMYSGDYLECELCICGDGSLIKKCYSLPKTAESILTDADWDFAGSAFVDGKTTYECRIPFDKLCFGSPAQNGLEFGFGYRIGDQSDYDEAPNMTEWPDVYLDEVSGAVTAKNADGCAVMTLTGFESDISFQLYGEILTVSGKGTIPDYDIASNPAPWSASANDITSVIIGEGITSIGEYAFCSFPMIKTISLPQSLKKIGTCAFSSCLMLRDVTIPGETLSIGSGAFEFCGMLSSVSIPASVRYIGAGVFKACSALTEISVAAENAYYASENGVLFDKSGSTLLAYPANLDAVAYVIPSHVTSVDGLAFYGCNNLQSISTPCTLKEYESVIKYCNQADVLIYHVQNKPTDMGDGTHCTNCACGENERILPHVFDIYTNIDNETHSEACECGVSKQVLHTFADLHDCGDGTHSGTCTVCGTEITEKHTVALCLDNGDGTHGGLCDKCKALYTEPHAFGDWVIKTVPTPESAGTRERVCTLCDCNETTDVTFTLSQLLEGVSSAEFGGEPTLCRGIRHGTNAQGLLELGITVVDAEGKLLDSSDIICTGSVLRLYDGDAVIDEAVAVVLGDVNGDGDVTVKDYVLVKRIFLKTIEIPKINALAGDIDRDGEIRAKDYVFVKRVCLGTYQI